MDNAIIYAIVFAAVTMPFLLFRKRSEAEKDSTPIWKAPVKILAAGAVGDALMTMNAGRVPKIRRLLVTAGQDGVTDVRDVFTAEVVNAVGFALVGIVVGIAVNPADPLPVALPAALIAGLMGYVLPATGVQKAAQKRQNDIIKALPFAIDLVVSAMRSGLDFGAAVRYYANMGMKGPLTEEFTRMLRENELGTGRIASLQNMAERIDVRDFTSFVSAVALGTEMGSPLSDTMEIQGEELRKARFAVAENKAQRAPSLMILPMAVFIMPAVFIIIIVPVFIRLKEAKG